MSFGVVRGLSAAALLVVGSQAAACREADPGFNGRSSAAWIAQLEDSSATQRATAASALGSVLRINPNYGPAIQALIGALSDTSDEIRVQAADALAREGVRAPQAVPGLITVLGDSAHPRVRATGARLLGRVLFQIASGNRGFRASGTIDDTTALKRGAEALVSATADGDLAVRLAAARSLRDLGPVAPAMSPRVHTALGAVASSPIADLRVVGIEGLVSTGAPPGVIVSAARAALADSQTMVRLSVVQALGRLGPPAASAIPDLVRTLSDPHALVRSASAHAIGQIAPEAAVEALRKALGDRNATVREEAAHALEGFHRRGGEDPPPPEPGARQR